MSLGPFPLLGAEPTDVHGHFESLPFHTLNRKVQEFALGFADSCPGRRMSWRASSRKTGSGGMRVEIPDALIKEGRQLVAELVGSGKLSGFKDPRTVLTWPFWQRVLTEFRQLRVVLIPLLRSPHEIAMSLCTRGDGSWATGSRYTAPDRVVRARAWLCDLPVEQDRPDAVQAFLKQETIFARWRPPTGMIGLGYSYTIGTGGELYWTCCVGPCSSGGRSGRSASGARLAAAPSTSTRATTIGRSRRSRSPRLDTAVWDARSRALGVGSGSWRAVSMSGAGLRHRGRLAASRPDGCRAQAPAIAHRGLPGVEDQGRPAVTPVMTRPGWRGAGGRRTRVGHHGRRQPVVHQRRGDPPRPHLFRDLDIFWFEEPLPADDVAGHARLASRHPVPVAVGESMYARRASVSTSSAGPPHRLGRRRPHRRHHAVAEGRPSG